MEKVDGGKDGEGDEFCAVRRQNLISVAEFGSPFRYSGHSPSDFQLANDLDRVTFYSLSLDAYSYDHLNGISHFVRSRAARARSCPPARYQGQCKQLCHIFRQANNAKVKNQQRKRRSRRQSLNLSCLPYVYSQPFHGWLWVPTATHLAPRGSLRRLLRQYSLASRLVCCANRDTIHISVWMLIRYVRCQSNR